MDWKDLASTVAKSAPALGAALVLVVLAVLLVFRLRPGVERAV